MKPSYGISGNSKNIDKGKSDRVNQTCREKEKQRRSKESKTKEEAENKDKIETK